MPEATDTATLDEQTAICIDAEQRLRELRALAAVLRRDCDDGEVLSELTSVESQIASAEAALGPDHE